MGCFAAREVPAGVWERGSESLSWRNSGGTESRARWQRAAILWGSGELPATRCEGIHSRPGESAGVIGLLQEASPPMGPRAVKAPARPWPRERAARGVGGGEGAGSPRPAGGAAGCAVTPRDPQRDHVTVPTRVATAQLSWAPGRLLLCCITVQDLLWLSGDRR